MIEFEPLQRNSDLIVVAVWVLAFPAVIALVVSRGNAIFNSNFVHDSSRFVLAEKTTGAQISGDLRRSQPIGGLVSIVSRRFFRRLTLARPQAVVNPKQTAYGTKDK